MAEVLKFARIVSPGEMLFMEWMHEGDYTPQQFADRLGISVEDLWLILSGEKETTGEVANMLGRGLGTSPVFWENTYNRALEERMAKLQAIIVSGVDQAIEERATEIQETLNSVRVTGE